MPESVKRRLSSEPTSGAMPGLSDLTGPCSTSSACRGGAFAIAERIVWLASAGVSRSRRDPRVSILAMVVQVRLFAMLRERAGRDSVEIDLNDGATVQDALEAVGKRHGLEDLIERMPVVAAINREYAGEASPLTEGDE